MKFNETTPAGSEVRGAIRDAQDSLNYDGDASGVTPGDVALSQRETAGPGQL